jgi:hypothetical protein
MVVDSVKKRSVPESTDVTTMKNSTKTLFATLAVLVFACATFNPQAQAVRINGGISFGGGFTTDTGDVNTATAITSF